jgi:hypothetical protein
MNDNYLWDRSGEPDPEVQELEEILGALRYQPRPLQLPADLRIGKRRTFVPAVAIAAAVAICALMLALWFHFNPRGSATNEVKSAPQKETVPQQPQDRPNETIVVKDQKQSPAPRHSEPNRRLVGNLKPNRIRHETREPGLTPQELAEKEQLLLALRMVSAKLNLAQRKTLGAPQPNIIRNQHKVG